MTLVAVPALKSNTGLFLRRRPCPEVSSCLSKRALGTGSLARVAEKPKRLRLRSRLVIASALPHQPGFSAGGHEYLCHPPQTFCPTWISRRRMWKPFFVQRSTVRNERILEEAISSLAPDPQLRRHPCHGLQYVRTQEIRTVTDACHGDRHFQKPKVVSLLTSDGLSFIAVWRTGRCSVSDGSFESYSC